MGALWALLCSLAGATPLALTVQDVAAQTIEPGGQTGFDATVGAMYSTDARAHGVLIRPRWQVAADVEISRGTFYAGTEHGVGFKVVNAAPVTIGVGFDYRSGRQESADPTYRGLGNVHGYSVVASYYEWTPFGPAFTMYGEVNVAVSHRHDTNYTVGARGGAPVITGVTAFVDASLAGADARYLHKFYGVSVGQSTTSGLSVFAPRAGPISLTVSPGLLIDIRPHWQLVASVGGFRYAGNVAESPLIRHRYYPVGVFATSYSF